MLCVIWCHLKNVINNHEEVILLVKFTSLWMFFTFFKLYKFYQIAWSITFRKFTCVRKREKSKWKADFMSHTFLTHFCYLYYFRYGILGFVFDYGCQTKVTSLSRIGATVSIGQASGVTLKVKCVKFLFIFRVCQCVCVCVAKQDILGKIYYIIWSPCYHSQIWDVYVNNFFPLTAIFWNSLLGECFLLIDDLNGLKSRVKNLEQIQIKNKKQNKNCQTLANFFISSLLSRISKSWSGEVFSPILLSIKILGSIS